MPLRGEAIEAEILPDLGMSIVSLRDGSGREQLRRRAAYGGHDRIRPEEEPWRTRSGSAR
jgi:hypothetical protein